MAVMDISVVNVALPHMMGAFGQDLSTITWVATGYSIAEIIMISMAGWLSTLIGRKRLYLSSFVVFTLGSILCGTAKSFEQMVVYRIIQGIGGGALIPVSQAILKETFRDKDQGMAMALFGMSVVIAPATGPILGGWLTDHFGWHWIFFINVPVSIVGITMVSVIVTDPAYLRRGVEKIDWAGIVLIALALTSMQIVLEKGQEKNWLESGMIVTGILITFFATLGLIFWEMRIKEPIINFRILRDVPLSVGSLMGLVFGIALFGTSFILPQFTQKLLGYTATQSGLILAPRAVMLALCMPIAGMCYRRFDPRLLTLFGVTIIFTAYCGLARISLNTGFWDLVPTLVIMGSGMPFMFVTLSAVSLGSVSRADMTHATSFYTLARRIGGNIGYAMTATVVARGHQVHRESLISHIDVYNPNFSIYYTKLTATLAHAGVAATTLKKTAFSLIDSMVDRQALMLAYNDVSWIFGLLFLSIIPLIFLLPSRRRINRQKGLDSRKAVEAS